MGPIWQPSRQRVEAASLPSLIRVVEGEWRIPIGDYSTLYRWSIEEPEQFWTSLWSFVGVSCAERGARVLQDGDRVVGYLPNISGLLRVAQGFERGAYFVQ